MRRILILILISLTTYPIFSQHPHKHQMHFYIDSSGKIYVNLHQPLYFKISRSPSPKARKYLLYSHATPNIVNPLYFRHEGANIVYTPWAIDTLTKKPIYPRVNVDFIVYADGTPPKTSIRLSRPGILFDDTLYFSRGLKVYLKAADNIVGVDSLFYSVDGADFKPFVDTLSFDQEKLYVIKYYSVDKVGNVEKVHKFVFKIDNSAPVSNFKIVGTRKGDVLSPRAKIEIKAQDQFTKVKKIVYTMDDGQLMIYRRPIAVASLPEGWHTLKYYAVDIMGNTTDTVKYKFFLDKTPPLILEEIIGNSYFIGETQYLSGNSKLKLTAVDNYSGVKDLYYSFDGKKWEQYTGPIPFPKAQKTFKLLYYAVDSVGNKSDINESMAQRGGVFTTFVDLTPPTISYTIENYYKYGDTVFISPQSRIRVTARDKESGLKLIYYQVDNDSVYVYKHPLNLITEGEHKLSFSALDNVNNISFKEVKVKVDTTAPWIDVVFSIHPYRLGKSTLAYPHNVKIFVTARDNMVGVKDLMVSVNHGSFRPMVTALSGFSYGENVVHIVAVDYLGNKRRQTIRFFVK